MAWLRNSTYVVVHKVVPYLKAPIPRHRCKLPIDDPRGFGCDLLAEILGDESEKRISHIRHEILGRVSRRHGKVGLHSAALATLRLGKDAKLQYWSTLGRQLATAIIIGHDFVSIDALGNVEVLAKLPPREVQARTKNHRLQKVRQSPARRQIPSPYSFVRSYRAPSEYLLGPIGWIPGRITRPGCLGRFRPGRRGYPPCP